MPHCLVSARGDLRLNMLEDSLKALSNHGSEACGLEQVKTSSHGLGCMKIIRVNPLYWVSWAVAQLCRFTNYKNIHEYSRFLQILTHFPFTWHDRLSKGWHDANFATRVSHSLGVWRNWRPPSCSREALQGVVKRIQTFLGKGWVRLVDPYSKYR